MARAQKAGAVSRGVVAGEIITPFDYKSLPADLAKELQDAVARRKGRISRHVQDIVETGADLLKFKARLAHGQFENWLDIEFDMSPRTAQKYMRATEWMSDKSELSSFLQPTTVYLLSAKSTPRTVQARAIERFEKTGKVEPKYVQMVIAEAKAEKRQAETKRLQAEACAARKRRQARQDRERKKKEEEDQRRDAAGNEEAREIASMLAAKLTNGEVERIHKGLGNYWVKSNICKAIAEVPRLTPEKVVKLHPKRSKRRGGHKISFTRRVVDRIPTLCVWPRNCEKLFGTAFSAGRFALNKQGFRSRGAQP